MTHYARRYNSILRTIHDFILLILKSGFRLFTDLDGLDAGNGRTITLGALVSSQRPDNFIVYRLQRKVILFELTVPWVFNVRSSHDLKSKKMHL